MSVLVDTFVVSIGGTAISEALEVEISTLLDVAPYRAGATGNDVLGANVVGRAPMIKIRCQNAAEAEIRRAIAIASGNAPLAVGAAMPTHVVHLRPFGDSNDARSFKFYAVRFESDPMVFRGNANYAWTITGHAQRATGGGDAGKVWEFGVAA